MAGIPAGVCVKILCLLDHPNLATAQQGLKIIGKGGNYYLVHQGEVQHRLGSRRPRKGANAYLLAPRRDLTGERSLREEPSSGILDKIFSSSGTWKAASACAKRSRET